MVKRMNSFYIILTIRATIFQTLNKKVTKNFQSRSKKVNAWLWINCILNILKYMSKGGHFHYFERWVLRYRMWVHGVKEPAAHAKFKPATTFKTGHVPCSASLVVTDHVFTAPERSEQTSFLASGVPAADYGILFICFLLFFDLFFACSPMYKFTGFQYHKWMRSFKQLDRSQLNTQLIQSFS